MDILNRKFSEMREPEFPETLHERIMRKIYYSRVKNMLLPLVIVLSVSLILLGWRAWTVMVDHDSFSVLQGMLDGFEVSGPYASQFWDTINESMPLSTIGVFLMNACMLGYVLYVANTLSRFKSHSRS